MADSNMLKIHLDVEQLPMLIDTTQNPSMWIVTKEATGNRTTFYAAFRKDLLVVGTTSDPATVTSVIRILQEREIIVFDGSISVF